MNNILMLRYRVQLVSSRGKYVKGPWEYAGLGVPIPDDAIDIEVIISNSA